LCDSALLILLFCNFSADRSHVDAIGDLIGANASLLLPAYEAALRFFATTDEGAAVVAEYVGPVVVAAACVASEHMIQHESVSPASSPTEQQQRQQLLRQLYALQVTCFKLWCAVRSTAGNSIG
jgi:hypothetical protein